MIPSVFEPLTTRYEHVHVNVVPIPKASSAKLQGTSLTLVRNKSALDAT